MNLHGIVSGAIGVVNPFEVVTIQVSTGYTTSADGNRVPKYAAAIRRPAQIQALSFDDLKQIEGLNIQGTRRALYINGAVDGLVRVENKGGDLITFADGSVWLVAQVLEHWPDWCKVVLTLQDQ